MSMLKEIIQKTSSCKELKPYDRGVSLVLRDFHYKNSNNLFLVKELV
jgi:hypothetical protein